MAKGGARNRNGTFPDPNSARSDARGITYVKLPQKGYRGRPPEFPLPNASSREVDVWEEAWRSPQAVAWKGEQWRWRTIALWVRISVRCEDDDVVAGLIAQVHRLADQIGMTPAGLRENGWVIEDGAVEKPAARPSSARRERRLRAVE